MANPKKTKNSTEPHSDTPQRKVATDDQRARAKEAAKRFQSDLPSEHPTEVISMLRSHVSGGFWLGLPGKFCSEHLDLKEKFEVVLESEAGSKHDVTYIGLRTGLSGGWRGFSIDHMLNEGDVVLFQLFKAEKLFKVFIFRAVEVGTLDVQEMKYARGRQSVKSKKVKRSRGDDETGLHSKNARKSTTDQDTGVQDTVEIAKAKERKIINSKKAKMCHTNDKAETKKPAKPVKVQGDSGSFSSKPQTEEKLFRKRDPQKLFRKRSENC